MIQKLYKPTQGCAERIHTEIMAQFDMLNYCLKGSK